MNDVLVLLAVGIAALLWWQSAVRAREQAAACVESACRDAGVQWLDGTVMFRRLQLSRDASGERCLRRTYVFDYCDDGVSRRQGFVTLRGRELELVGFGPTAVGASA